MSHLAKNVTCPSFLLMYSPLQFGPQDSVKPDGSLSLPYLAAGLKEAGFEVKILDAAVGNERDDLADTFFRPEDLPSGLVRVGMSRNRIAEEIANYDVIGISSIFTFQTTMVLDLVRLVKEVDPTKLVIAGGVNARCLADRFFDAGVDLVFLSEAEKTVVQLGQLLRAGSRDFSGLDGVSFKDREGTIVTNRTRELVRDLDELPMPAWDMLPLDKYWDISRPHGGDFSPGTRIQYNAMMTSRGCPFACSYCHISRETEGSLAGNIGGLRLKSIDRVVEEIRTLKALGTEYLFIEDDSLLAKKKRSIEIFRAIRGENLRLIDVNGVNIAHMVTRTPNGLLVPDIGLLGGMADCGFEKISLPFESASQRIIDKYASKKWRTDRLDTVELVRMMNQVGITALGNYTIGYPDETFEEMMETIMLAQRHMDAGLAVASFFVIVPFPGSALFDMAVKGGHLSPDFDPDEMRWTRSIMRNTPVSADALEHIRTLAWKLVNRPEFVKAKESTGFGSLIKVSSNSLVA